VPVRQFIAAGGAKEELPAKSAFVPLFLHALNGRASNLNDGYVTGKEMGVWLEQMLPTLQRNQNPHSGVIQDTALAFGDMIFQVPAHMASPSVFGLDSSPVNTDATRTVSKPERSAPAPSSAACVEISESRVVNGVVTWMKRCI
jgi:hypothetical protein